MGWGRLNWKVDKIFNKEIKFNNFYFCHSFYIDSPTKKYNSYIRARKNTSNRKI